LPTSIIDRGRVIDKISDIDIEGSSIVTLKLKTVKINEVFKSNVPCSVICSDSEGNTIKIIIFFKSSWLWQSIKANFLEGDVIVSGKVTADSFSKVTVDGRNKKYQIVNPDIVKPLSKFSQQTSSLAVEPVYPLTAGLSNTKLKKMIDEALKIAETELMTDWMNSTLLTANRWPTFLDSLKSLHAPKSLDCLKTSSKAYQRLAFDEILSLYLTQLSSKNESDGSVAERYRLAGERIITKELERVLPFSLTKSQRSAIDDIFEDVKSDKRMMRLVQGDVGSGKTVVAIMAMLRAVESGKQACLLAPTEILANQHYSTINSFLSLIKDVTTDFNSKSKGVARPCIARLITGSIKQKERDEILKSLKEGSVDIVVGTHSLLGEEVVDSLQNLGLAVIDEEQRFGVNQRDVLAKRCNVILTSATPIPRSLMLLLQDDYSISTLLEKPPAKRPIQTVLLGVSLSEKVIDRVRANLPYGSKIFWITPCLHPSTSMPGSSAFERVEQLSKLFPGKVALLHGKMSSEEKKTVMANFSATDTPIQILVATSVVEVGIDVPDASICVIDHAENFGLSQLHQIRGRVGRGAAPPQERLKECYCVLLFNDHKLSTEEKGNTDIEMYKAKAAEAQSKLQILVDSNDGFEIAEADFRNRGPGDIFGVRQHGFDVYKFAQINEHTQLFAEARIIANKMIKTGSLVLDEKQRKSLVLQQSMFTNSKTGLEVKSSSTIEPVLEKVKPTSSEPKPKRPDLRVENCTFVLFDLETTGFNKTYNRIIQIAAKTFGKDDVYNAYVLPVDSYVSEEIENLTGISQEFLNDNGMPIDRALVKFSQWLSELKDRDPDKEIVLVAHNALKFDIPFLRYASSLSLSSLSSSSSSSTIRTEIKRSSKAGDFLKGHYVLDSLQVLKDGRLWTGGKPASFSLPTIHKFLIKEEFAAHNALEDVFALENVLTRVAIQEIVHEYIKPLPLHTVT